MGLGAHFLFYRRQTGMNRPIDKRGLIEQLEPLLEGLGFELVDLDLIVGSRGLLRLFIDSESGVTLADCELVSEQVGAYLDVEDPLPGRYTLEVSSPGLDRRLRTPEHFRRFSGSEAKLELKRSQDGRRRLKGRIEGIDDELVVLNVDGKIWRLKLADIAMARLVPQY